MDIVLKEAKRFVMHFLPLIIATAVLLLLYILYYNGQADRVAENGKWYYDSTNTGRVYGEQRVFDYADKLTPDEETELEQYIHEAEKKTILDIVIVTLNESLADYEPEYKAAYSMEITPDRYVMVYGDKFWEDNGFGYDCPQVLDGTTDTGDGVILVDNCFREPETGKVYTWLCTTGRAEVRYSELMIDENLDEFYVHVDDDYFRACCDFVDGVVRRMAPYEQKLPTFFHILPFIIGVIILVWYCKSDRSFALNVKRVNADTFMRPDSYKVSRSEDILIDKNVTSTYVPPSYSSGTRSGGGGGGHHISGGGGSHGGGGHSR